MDEYKKAYLILFNAITKATEDLDRGKTELISYELRLAQQKAEEAFITFEQKQKDG